MNFPTCTVPESLSIRRLDSLEEIDREAWNTLAGNSNPFLRHEFLSGLEQYRCLAGHGWQPYHIVVFDRDVLVGALPLYLKDNSYGEFVFDWAWADAYERAGGHYYPKLVSAIPFSPVRGARMLVAANHGSADSVRKALLQSVIDLIETLGFSSYHCLFPEQPDSDFMKSGHLLVRKGVQFHWFNRNYRDFDDFLDSLTSKKRKQIRRERRLVAEKDIEIEVLKGDKINAEQWRIFHEFYCSTFHRRWGAPRMTYEFFKSLSKNLPAQTLLILASKNGKYVAGAFAMVGEDTVYGRHWGCNSDHPYLHFELCYYQTIEYCIMNKLKKVDAGVQGEHKLSRGFEPVATYSCHWIRHQGFRDAIQEFLERESSAIDDYIRNLNYHLPYKSEINILHQ